MNGVKHNLAFIFVMLAVVLSSCDFYYKNMPFAPIPPQPISGPVEITSEWVEIVPPKPLKPLGHTNWIKLGYAGFKEMKDTKTFDQSILEMADGRNSKVEGFLYDEKGEEFALELTQSSGGPELYRKGVSKLGDGKTDYSAVQLPTDRVYTRLKIRSEIPIKCDKIEWWGDKPQ
jgi:hypothetical protein